MTTIRTLIAGSHDRDAIYTLRRVGEREPYALESSVRSRGITYSREFDLGNDSASRNERMRAARRFQTAIRAKIGAQCLALNTAKKEATTP